MLNKIISFSLRNRLFIIVAALILMMAGIYSARTLEVDVFPDLNAPTVVVMTEVGGMAPEEVEQLVTFPIETAVGGAGGVRRVRSSSTTGFSVVWVEFDWNTPVYTARQIVSERMTQVAGTLPPGVGNPTLGPQSSILGEVMFVALTSETTDLQELRTLADWSVRPRLLTVNGVAQVAVLGGEIKEYQILLDPAKMSHYGVSLDEVLLAVGQMNRNVSGGTLYEYGQEYIIRGVVSTNHLDELGRAVVKTDSGGEPLLLSHLAEIKVSNKRPRMGTASVEGRNAVIMTITKQPHVGTLELTGRLDKVIAELKDELPHDISVQTDIYRQERFINSSIDNVKKSLYEGGLFVVIILFLFLMNGRTTLISVVSIPFSLLITILVLRIMGLTINTMSLGGMAIAIGSLVDDAIVDVENVFKRLRENRTLPENQKKPLLTVIFEASKEVRAPILNSTLIIIASFIPLFFLSGMEGRMLAPLGVAFIVSLTASTLVALTLTPVLCSFMLADGSHSGKEKEAWTERKLKEGYGRLLALAINKQKWVLSVTILLLVAAVVFFVNSGKSFLPPFNEGSYTVNVSSMPGISLDEADFTGHTVETLLLDIPEIQTVGRKTGRAELDEHALGINTSEIEAPFLLGRRSKEELLSDIRARLKTIPGVNVEVGSPIQHRIDAMLSGTGAAVAIKLFGPDLEKLHSIGEEIKEVIEDVEGVTDLNVEQQVLRPQLQIKPKRAMLAKYGITLPEFGELVGVLLNGEVVSSVYEADRSFDLTLKVRESDRDNKRAIEDLVISLGESSVPLCAIAEVTSKSGPNTINRENSKRKIVISANAGGRDLVSVVEDIRKAVSEKISLPENYFLEYGGQAESQKSAERTLLLCSVISLLVIYLLLYSQFHNLTQAAVILLNLPLALIGGVFALRLTGGDMSIPAIIGFISLFGIATRNGMLLVTRYNDLSAGGLSPLERVLQGSRDRLNPILMTALTSGLALIPLALGGDLPGNEIQSPMAIVILGGLFTSTLLNGFILPIIYLLIHKK